MQDADRSDGRKAGHIKRLAVLAASVMIAAPSLASAQVLDPLRGYAFDGTPTGAPRAEPRGRDAPQREAVERQRPAYVSTGQVRRMAARQGYKLATMPQRRGRVYFALAENSQGHRFELTFNAYNALIVAQRDIGPTAVAKAPEPAPVTTSTAAPVATAKSDPGTAETKVDTAKVDTPKAAEPASPADVAIATAKVEADKAAAAEKEARRVADVASADARRAQVKLAEAQANARRAAEVKAQEARRQMAIAAEQRRQEARALEANRIALATAEAKLAQARVMQARVEADVRRAEMQAAAARAAIPAQMGKAAEKPAEMAPVAKAPEPAPAKAAETPATGGKTDSAKSDAAKTDSAKIDSAKTDSAKTDSAISEATKPAETAIAPAATDSGKGQAARAIPDGEGSSSVAKTAEPPPAAPLVEKAPEAGEPKQAATEAPADGTDRAPTGSMIQSPPAPYAAPTPDAAAAGSNP